MVRIIFYLVLLGNFALQACLLKESKKKKVNDTSVQDSIVPLSPHFNQAQQQIAARIVLHDPGVVRDIGLYPHRIASLLYSTLYIGEKVFLYNDKVVQVSGETLCDIAEKANNIEARNAMVVAYFKDAIDEFCAEN